MHDGTPHADAAAQSERRAYERLRGLLPIVQTRLFTGGEWIPVQAIVADVSEGGLLLYSEQEIVVNDALEFTIADPDDPSAPPERVGVEVVYVHHLPGRVPLWRAGGRFHETDPAARQRLVQLVQRQARQEAE